MCVVSLTSFRKQQKDFTVLFYCEKEQINLIKLGYII